MISVVAPALNAQTTLAKALGGLTRAAIEGLVREVIVVDGGSDDATAEIADDAGATLVSGPGLGADRGAQLAAGAAAARSPWIMTLRQDAHLLPGWEAVVSRHLERSPGSAGWFFLERRGLPGWLTGPSDGAALLVPRALYDRCGGFGDGRAEAALARTIGRRRRVQLRVPMLSPDD